jgi:exosortase/archaeosortase family protein
MRNLGIPKNVDMSSVLSQHRLSIAIKFSAIAAAIIALYAQDLSLVLSDAISDEATFHILAVPFLLVYLLYRKRKMIAATLHPSKTGTNNVLLNNFSLIAGTVLSAAAIIVYWYGSYTFTPLEYHMLTLPFFTAGLTLILFNGSTLRQLAFPIAFLVFLTPPPTEILYSVGATLSDLSAHASNALANLFGMSSTISAQYGNPVITLTRPDQSPMSFSVDVACSGVYSLIGFIIFAVFIGYITRGKLYQKLAILIMGIPLIIALNITRITTILAIGYNYGDQIALQVFHALGATVLMFIGTLILLAITEKAFKKPKPLPPCPTCNPIPPKVTDEFCPTCGKLHTYPKTKLNKTDLAKIVTLGIIIAFLLTIQAPVFALAEGPAEIMIQTPSGLQPNTQRLPLPQIPGYNLSYVYRDTDFEKLSGQDASLAYAYSSTNQSKPIVWVSVEVASTLVPLHRWETCLINYPLSEGWQPRVTQLNLTDIQTQSNPPIVARYFAFQWHSDNQTQVVLYWYETATFSANNQTQQKHVKISLVMDPQSPQAVKQAENLLPPIATAINDYWQPIKTWTTIALALSQNGLALLATTTALLATLIIYRILIDQQEKNTLRRLYPKLPEQTQQLITAVKNAQKQKNPTTRNIIIELEKVTNTTVDEAWLTEKLEETQKAGLIKKQLINQNDNPTITWKNKITDTTQNIQLKTKQHE